MEKFERWKHEKMEKLERELLIWTLIFLAIAFAWSFFYGSFITWLGGWMLNPIMILYLMIMSFLNPPLSTIWIIGALVIFYRELKRRKKERLNI